MTGAVSRRFPLPYADPRGLVVAGESIWVLAYNSLRTRTVLLRYPPTPRLAGEFIEPLAQIAVPGQPSPSAVGNWLVADARDIWLLATLPGLTGAATSALYRVDHETPGEADPVATFDLAEGLAVGAGGVWVTTQARPRAVFRVDAATGGVLEEPWGTRDTGPLAVADGSLWIGDFLDGSVARIDPSSGETVATTRVSEAQPPGTGPPTYSSIAGAYLNGLAADATGVWALTTSDVVVI